MGTHFSKCPALLSCALLGPLAREQELLFLHVAISGSFPPSAGIEDATNQQIRNSLPQAVLWVPRSLASLTYYLQFSELSEMSKIS